MNRPRPTSRRSSASTATDNSVSTAKSAAPTHATLSRLCGTGSVGGSGGCNAYQGDYATDGSKLVVERLIATMKLCDEPAGVSDQEATFLALLTSADEFVIETID